MPRLDKSIRRSNPTLGGILYLIPHDEDADLFQRHFPAAKPYAGKAAIHAAASRLAEEFHATLIGQPNDRALHVVGTNGSGELHRMFKIVSGKIISEIEQYPWSDLLAEVHRTIPRHEVEKHIRSYFIQDEEYIDIIPGVTWIKHMDYFKSVDSWRSWPDFKSSHGAFCNIPFDITDMQLQMEGLNAVTTYWRDRLAKPEDFEEQAITNRAEFAENIQKSIVTFAEHFTSSLERITADWKQVIADEESDAASLFARNISKTSSL